MGEYARVQPEGFLYSLSSVNTAELTLPTSPTRSRAPLHSVYRLESSVFRIPPYKDIWLHGGSPCVKILAAPSIDTFVIDGIQKKQRE